MLKGAEAVPTARRPSKMLRNVLFLALVVGFADAFMPVLLPGFFCLWFMHMSLRDGL